MAVKKTGLGKGLDSLIPTQAASKKELKKEETPVKTIIKQEEMKLRLSEIEPNRSQPRKKFDEDSLLELADSIKQFGLLQPLLVQKKKDYYEIIAGEKKMESRQNGRSERGTGYHQRFFRSGDCGNLSH